MRRLIYNVILLISATIFAHSCSKIEETIAVQSISVNKASIDLYVGDTFQLTANVFPDNATNKTVYWTSLSSTIVTVSNNGLISAIKEGNTSIVASAEDKASECTVTVHKKIIEVSSLNLNKTSIELFKGESEILSATVLPSDATDKNVLWSVEDKEIALIEQDGKVTALRDGETSISATAGNCSTRCKITVKIKQPEAIDLGISVKWASFDLGASSDLDEGNKYAWGETSVKSSYTWGTYKWCKGTDESLTKYCYDSFYGYNGFTDTLTILEKSDDAASVNLGGTWRMPTSLEIGELLDNCDVDWVNEGEYNKYVRFTSKINGKSIRFKCPESNYDKCLSSELKPSYFGARYSYSLCLFKGRNCFVSDAGRNDGNYIRPVCN